MVVPSGRSLLALLNDPSHFEAAPTYAQAFFTEMEFENRTSLITDPPTGRLPSYTPEGQRRRDAKLYVSLTYGVLNCGVDLGEQHCLNQSHRFVLRRKT